MVQVSTIVQGGLKIVKYGGRFVAKHLPTILTGVGTVGVVAGVVVAIQKAPDAKKELDEEKEKWDATEDKEKRVKSDYIFKRIRIGAKHYWMVVLIIGGSITCFWLANKISIKRLTQALTAAGLSAKAKEELEEKIKDLDGEKHLQKVKDEIDADKVKNNPPVESEICNTGYGTHRCYEPITGRYFYSSIERIRQSVITCRDYLQKYGYLSLNDWFEEIGLESTDLKDLCWTANSIEEINEFGVSFSSTLAKDGAPVIVLRYDVNPVLEYRDW